MIHAARRILNIEKEWLLSQIGLWPFLHVTSLGGINNDNEGLIPDCDDDVMDEVRLTL